MRNKPFNEIWANSPQNEGDVTPPNTTTWQTGWRQGPGAPFPRADYENYWHQRVDEALQYIERHGHLNWMPDVPYAATALVVGSDGLVYSSLSDNNQGNDPTQPGSAAWRRYNLVYGTRQVSTGDGLQGGGNLDSDRTLSVDGTVVRTSRSIGTGSGLTGGGSLSANRTLSVDSSVVRTSQFNGNLGESGWERNDITGVIHQWGSTAHMNGDSNASVSFSIQFPNSCWKVFASIRNGVTGDDEVFPRIISWNRSGVTVRADICSPNSSVAGSGRYIDFYAIGN